MDVYELICKLKEIGVPEDYYSVLVGGLPNEKLCIVKTQSEKWEVYYSERGARSGIKLFDSEADACEYFLKKMQKYAQKGIVDYNA